MHQPNTRFNDDEFALIKSAVAQCDLSVAGFLARSALAAARDLDRTSAEIADEHDLITALFDSRRRLGWVPGARLAPDLSLPRIRERWSADHPDQTPPVDTPVRATPDSPAAARRRTASAAWTAVMIVEHGDDPVAAAYIAAAGEVLDALAKTSAAHIRRELRDAATAFERASRSHVRAERGHDRALRQAARDLVNGGPALGRGEDGATTAMVIDMLFFLITATVHWHAKKNHAQQAEAATRAAEHLRAAYQAAGAQPIGVLYRRGRYLKRPELQRHKVMLREALPELAEQILAEPGWYALAATLDDVATAGHDPVALLTDATQRRELGTAESVSDVLVWRLRRTAGLPADPSDEATHRPRGHHSPQPAGQRVPDRPGSRRARP